MDNWQQRYTDLAEAALECASDLEDAHKARYYHNGEIMHPALQHKFDRDMQPVMLVRKLVLGK